MKSPHNELNKLNISTPFKVETSTKKSGKTVPKMLKIIIKKGFMTQPLEEEKEIKTPVPKLMHPIRTLNIIALVKFLYGFPKIKRI